MTNLIDRIKHKAKVKPGQAIRVMPGEVLAEIEKRDDEIARLKAQKACDHSMAEIGNPICPGCTKWLG